MGVFPYTAYNPSPSDRAFINAFVPDIYSVYYTVHAYLLRRGSAHDNLGEFVGLEFRKGLKKDEV